MFLQSLVKLTILFQFRILLLNSGEDKKKFSLHSGSISVRNFRFLDAKWVLLAKKPMGPDIFRPLQSQTQGRGCPLVSRKSTPAHNRSSLCFENLDTSPPWLLFFRAVSFFEKNQLLQS